MFDKFSKNQKFIIYFLILFSFLFVLPIFFWTGWFIGYKMCKRDIENTFKLEKPLSEYESKKNENYLTLKKI